MGQCRAEEVAGVGASFGGDRWGSCVVGMGTGFGVTGGGGSWVGRMEAVSVCRLGKGR